MPYIHESTEYEIRKSWELEELKNLLSFTEWEACRQSGVVRRLLLEHSDDRSLRLATEFEDGKRELIFVDSGVVVTLGAPMKSQAGPISTYMKQRAEALHEEKMKGHVEGGIRDIVNNLSGGVESRHANSGQRPDCTGGRNRINADPVETREAYSYQNDKSGSESSASPAQFTLGAHRLIGKTPGNQEPETNAGSNPEAPANIYEDTERCLALEGKARTLPEGKMRENILNLITHGKHNEASQLLEIVARQSPIIGRHVFASSINSSWAKLAEAFDGKSALYINYDTTFQRFRFVEVDDKGVTRNVAQPEWETYAL